MDSETKAIFNRLDKLAKMYCDEHCHHFGINPRELRTVHTDRCFMFSIDITTLIILINKKEPKK